MAKNQITAVAEQVVSADGTPIAFERTGSGPALVLVDGALCHRAFGPARPFAERLKAHFTVYTYDRRGRGGSGDTLPYDVGREVEDLNAVIAATGGPAYVFGQSSGAALAAEAANRGLPIRKLALFEAPFVLDGSGKPRPADLERRMDALIAADQRTAAVKLFMRTAGVPAPMLAIMPLMPMWSQLKAVAPTIPYDYACLEGTGSGRPLPAGRYAGVSVPTLVMAGGKSPEWMRNAQEQIAAAIGGARSRTLPGQTHMLKAEAVEPVLVEFFGS